MKKIVLFILSLGVVIVGCFVVTPWVLPKLLPLEFSSFRVVTLETSTRKLFFGKFSHLQLSGAFWTLSAEGLDLDTHLTRQSPYISLNVSFPRKALVKIKDASFGPGVLNAQKITLDTSPPFRLTRNSLQGSSINLSLAGLSWKQGNKLYESAEGLVAVKHLIVPFTGKHRTSGTLALEKVRTSLPNLTELEGRVLMPFSLSQETLLLSPTLEIPGLSVVVYGELKHDGKKKGGEFTAHAELAEENFSKALRLAELPGEIPSGRLTLRHVITWGPEEKRFKLHSDGSGIDYRAPTVDTRGVEFSGNFSGDTYQTLRSEGPVRLKADAIQSFITIENVEAQFFLDLKSPFPLQKALGSVKLLDGKAAFAQSKDKEHTYELKLSDIDLGELLALYGQKNLSGTGRISGILPLRFSPKTGLTIAEGTLTSAPQGGIIRYQVEQDATPLSSQAAPTQLQFALQALENFHYESLKAQASLTEEQLLHLQLEIIGKNPDLNTQRPIHVNLSVEENLRALIKSLNIGKNLTDTLLGHYEG